MIIMMPEHKVKGAAKRLRKVLDGCGVEMRHVQCLELVARLHGFESWRHYLHRDLDAPFSPFDDDLSEAEFAARDEFQMDVLHSAGLGAVARELLDHVNPTGSWARSTSSNVSDQTAASAVAPGGGGPARIAHDGQITVHDPAPDRVDRHRMLGNVDAMLREAGMRCAADGARTKTDRRTTVATQRAIT